MLPENTANIFGIVVEWNKGGWGYPPGLKYASDRQDPFVGSWAWRGISCGKQDHQA